MDLSVVIVNYNVREFLEQALRSVQRAAAGLAVEVFVVDNNSVDGSVEMVRTTFPDVRLLVNEENVGFSRANNQAIRQARGRYLLILNPDTIVQEDTLSTLVGFMDAHPGAGAVGCTILNPDGTFALESRRAFPTPRVAFFRMIGLSRLFPRSPRFGRYNMTYLPADAEAEVDALSGSCMLVRHAALYWSREEALREGGRGKGEKGGGRVPSDTSSCPSSYVSPVPPSALRSPLPGNGAGLLDESFFMYGEDLDWCYRIQQAGWSIHYTPATQIIHYKGESTKKGELRYVRLFYGAMLRFAEKHLEDRYSLLFGTLLRVGVFMRAGLMVLLNALRRLRAPGIDALLVAAVVTGLGLARSVQTGVSFAPWLFYGLVAPGYALSTVAAVAALGGYRPRQRDRLRPVWMGAFLGLLIVAALSFFVKPIGFSRLVVLASCPVGAAVLSVLRWGRRARRVEPRRAVLVGPAAEARRLHRMLGGHLHPPFELVGYLSDADEPGDDGTPDVPRLGSLRHLRDLVRLRRLDDVVFAAAGLSNQTVFRLMQHLHGLPVQARILAEGREHVIGKASVADLSTPSLIEAEAALGTLRSPAARRAFEGTVALAGLVVHPVIWGLSRLAGPASVWARLVRRTRQLPAVFAGRRALVGYAPDAPFRPPPEWDLRPGVFAVTEMLGTPDPTPDESHQAYWFYVRNQSAFLDWTILTRALRNG